MPNYRRARNGNTYFFTVVTQRRQDILSSEKSRDALRDAISKTRVSYPFEINAWVLLPNHLHCIWTLPHGDTNYSVRWGLIKRRFSTSAKNWLNRSPLTASQTKHREAGIWQRRFWEHMIRDDRDYADHFDYIHYNPVKHGLVKSPKDWQYSTFHRAQANGVYPPNWGLTVPEIGGEQW